MREEGGGYQAFTRRDWRARAGKQSVRDDAWIGKALSADWRRKLGSSLWCLNEMVHASVSTCFWLWLDLKSFWSVPKWDGQCSTASCAPRFQGKLRRLGVVRLSVGACCLAARTDFPRIYMLISWQYDFAQRDPLVHLCIGRSEYQCSKSNWYYHILSVSLFAPQHFSGWVYCL